MKPTIAATATAFALLFAGGAVTAASAKTKIRHHRHVAPAPVAAPEPYAAGPFVQVRDSDRFYPNEIEGGVRGNLSFNNKLRKLSDPLNANGGGG